MRHARRILVPLLAALLVVGLTACGSGGGSAKVGSAREVLSDTFGPNKPVKSGRLNLGLRFNSTGLQGLDGPITATLTGPFQSKGGKTLPAFDFDLALNAAGADFSAGAISTGDAGYVKLQGTTYRLSDKFFAGFNNSYKTAASDSKSESSVPGLQTLGIDPRRWLSAPRKVGTEKVGGAESTHVSATVDVPKLLQDVNKLLSKAGTLGGTAAAGIPKGLSASQQAEIAKAVKSTSFDVWAGVDDGILRRLKINVAFDIPKAAQSSAGGLKSGDLTIDLTIADLNKSQSVAAPKNARSSAELTAQLNELLGGLLGGSPNTSTGSGSSSGSGAASGQTSDYLECLGKAGADIAKVQACASLLDK